MPFPRKFKQLIETDLDKVEVPDYLILTYAVCACEPKACGWGGWMIEVAYKKDGQRHPTGSGDRALNAFDVQTCPECGRETFRTAASLVVAPTADQSAAQPKPHASKPISYHD